MSRSRQEIVDSLQEQASYDPVLSSVVNSLVGKELLYFGANVVYQVESLGDVISRFNDIARADFNQLIAFAYTNDVPCDTCKPATVRITLNLSSVRSFPPFSIYLKVGGVRFYNIDFVRSDQVITLYQGTPKAVTSIVASQEGSKLDAFGLDSANGGSLLSYEGWKLYKEFSSGRYQSSYVKLGKNVVSDSIRVFAREVNLGDQENSIVFPYTEYNQQLASPQSKLYKVRTGWDRSINVLFGDDNWSSMINQTQYQYEIYWLEAGTVNYSITSNNVLYLGFDGSLDQKQLKSDSTAAEYYKVESSTMAESDSLAYAKNFVVTKKFATQGIVTETQISAYLSSLSVVNSSKVEVDSETGQVTIMIKPSDPNDVMFGFIEDFLYQYGVGGIQYKVITSTPLKFSVYLKPLNSIGASQLIRAASIVEDFCSYENLSINIPISSATLNQRLQSEGVSGVSATIKVVGESVSTEGDGSMKLSATPEYNTIEQTSGGRVVGFDSDGIYKSLTGSVTISSESIVSKAGDFYFVSDSSQNVLVDLHDTPLSVDVTNVITDKSGNPVRGKFFEHSDSGMVFFCTEGTPKILEYSSSSAFSVGDTSVFKRTSAIRPVSDREVDLESFVSKGLIGSTNSLEFVQSCPMAFVGGSVYLTVNLNKLGSPEYKTVRLSLGESGKWEYTTVEVSPSTDYVQKLFVYQNKIFVPLQSEIGEFTRFSYYDTVSGVYSQGNVTIQSDVTKLISEVYVSGSVMYMLTQQQESSVQLLGCNFRLSGTMSEMQVSVMSVLEYSDIMPDSIVSVSSSGICSLSGYPYIWESTSQSNSKSFDISTVPEFVSSGYVDYINGVIYGIESIGSADVVTYSVSGTLLGGITYPELDKVSTDE